MEASKIAAAVQAGQADWLELWETVRRFAYDRAYRWCRAMEGRGGMVLEDYIQVAFLALLEALEGWDPAAGAFLTWYGLKLKGAFTEAVGMRTQRDKRDPIHHALSLDAPLTDSESGEDLTLADVIEDPYAAAEVEAVGEWDALYRAVESLPEAQQTAIRQRYWLEQKVDNKAHAAALRTLRHPRVSRGLRIYV